MSLYMFSEYLLNILRFNLGVDSITDYNDRSKGACSHATHSLKSKQTVFACPADVGSEFLPQSLEAISRTFHITRCSKANANCPPTLWFEGEQRVKGCHPVNLTFRYTQPFGHELLDIFRQTPKELLGPVEHRNKGARLVLVFIYYIMELFEPVVRKLSMTLTFSAPGLRFGALYYGFRCHLT